MHVTGVSLVSRAASVLPASCVLIMSYMLLHVSRSASFSDAVFSPVTSNIMSAHDSSKDNQIGMQ